MPDDENKDIEQVGPVDPDKKTSQIIPTEGDDSTNVCYYNGQEYSQGSQICQFGKVYTCYGGSWVQNIGETC